MTKREKIIVSAYTGVLMCDFADMQKYAEEKLGYSLFTHDFANPHIVDKIKEAAKEDFLEICNKEEE